MKTWKVLGCYILTGTVCFAANVSTASSDDATRDGFFAGVGADYNSVNITQNSWGKGVSNIRTSTGADSNGVAQGNGAPFHNVNNSLGPNIQAGYLRHLNGSPNFFGVKFTYQYLNSTATNTDLYIPQIGQTTSAITGITSPLVGYVNAEVVQPLANQQINLLFLAGRSFGNASLYVGIGPSWVNLQSHNYYSIGYANFEGATINVTGLVSYSSPPFWALGGTAQLGTTYFFSPSWFVDMSYTYTLTGNTTSFHQQSFSNTSSLGTTTYATSGMLYTKDTLSVANQSLMLTVNKVFDL